MAAILLVYGNVSAYLTSYAGLTLPGGMLVPNLVGTGLLLWWAIQGGGLTAEDLGLREAGVFGSALWGVLAGVLMALPALAVFAFPPLLPAPITYQPVAAMSQSRFLWRILVEVPVGTALCEELAFRGVLQALFLRSVAPLAAVLATSTVFALWHVVVNYRTVAETNISGSTLVPLALIGGLIGVFVGGAVFSALRLLTGNLTGSIIAHWIVDALMIAFVYRSQ